MLEKSVSLINIPRRVFLQACGATVGLTLLGGCPLIQDITNEGQSDSSGTGIRGLNTPSEILTNPYVK